MRTRRRTGGIGAPFYAEDLAYIHDAGFTDLTRRLAPQIVRLLRRDGRKGRSRVVEFGCGGGVVARALVDAGFDVLGIDLSRAMLRLARRNVPEATFKRGTLATARIPPCRAIVAAGEVVSYVVEQPGGLPRFFARAAKALEPGGLLLFDFMESADGRTYELKSWAGGDWALVARASLHRGGHLLTRHMTTFRKIGSQYRRGEEVHTVRIVPRAEMAEALRRAGFAVTMRRSLGGVTLMPGDVLAIAFKEQAPPD